MSSKAKSRAVTVAVTIATIAVLMRTPVAGYVTGEKKIAGY